MENKKDIELVLKDIEYLIGSVKDDVDRIRKLIK